MTDPISSLQNPKIKLANSLQIRARTRRKERKIVLEGTRLVGDAVEQGHRADFFLYEAASVDYELLAKLQNTSTPLISVTNEVMLHVSDTQSPQGVVGVFRIPQPALPKQAARILILDAVSEPGNMGTILRSAGASGVDVVLLAPDCVDPYNPKVLRAGMGAHFRVPLIEATWQDITVYCNNIAIYAAASDGDVIYSDIDWTQRWALIIGNEAHGIGATASNLAQRIQIPMAQATESINASVATGVILFEAQRQRLKT